MFELDGFIREKVIKRQESLFLEDIDAHLNILKEKISRKTFLVIGGAGSIGSSFIAAILPFSPKELVVVDINENALTEMTRFLRSSNRLFSYIPEKFHAYPMDYHSIPFERMLKSHFCHEGKFDIVANFSAHKHVRSEKDIYSIEALIRNNLINVKNLLDLLCEYPPEDYFSVSTDKAANPVNIMGASKRIMEDMAFSYSDIFSVKTARFANVAFSNGSLPDGFLHRINFRQAISAPSNVKRFFVSQEESGQICMLAAILGHNRNIFFPKLDNTQMTSFQTIAEDILCSMDCSIDYCMSEQEAIEKSAKWQEGWPYPVYFSCADTSGEKTYEEFYTEDEVIDMKRFKSLGVIIDKQAPEKMQIERLMNSFEGAFNQPNCSKQDIIDIICQYLSNFNHIETGKCLDEKM